MSAAEEQSALVFASVFVLVWCGAAVVTLNAALLGGNMYVILFREIIEVLLFVLTLPVHQPSFSKYYCENTSR